MASRTFLVRNPDGMHARPASLFAQAALTHPAAVRLSRGEKTVSAKSILAVLTLGVRCGDTITIEIEGENDALFDQLGDIVCPKAPTASKKS